MKKKVNDEKRETGQQHETRHHVQENENGEMLAFNQFVLKSTSTATFASQEPDIGKETRNSKPTTSEKGRKY